MRVFVLLREGLVGFGDGESESDFEGDEGREGGREEGRWEGNVDSTNSCQI